MKTQIEVMQMRINELENLVAELRIQAEQDKLTGCLRREGFGAVIESRKRFGLLPKNSSLIIVDLDFFKRINDTYGHLTGDKVLESVGKILRTEVPESTIVSRMGGEEFVVLVSGEVNVAHEIAEHLRKIIEESPLKLNLTQMLHFTASFGIAGWDTDCSIHDSLAKADAALYTAKREGRNRVAA